MIIFVIFLIGDLSDVYVHVHISNLLYSLENDGQFPVENEVPVDFGCKLRGTISNRINTIF